VVCGQQYLTADVDSYIVPPQLSAERPAPPRVLEGIKTLDHLWAPPVYQSYSLLGISNVGIYVANRLGAHLHLDPATDWRLKAFRACGAVALLVGCLAVARYGRGFSGSLLMLVGLFLAFLAEYMTLSVRHLYGEVFQILPYGVLGPMLLERGLPRFYRGCGAVGISWSLLSYVARLLPDRAGHWLSLVSWLGPYSALVFFGGAVLYLARQHMKSSSGRPAEATCG
jgi:hypothetical protein